MSNADTRIAIGEPLILTAEGDAACCFTITGYGRTKGDFGPYHFKRIYDEDDEPIGYERLSGLGGHPKPANEGHLKTGQRRLRQDIDATEGYPPST